MTKTDARQGESLEEVLARMKGMEGMKDLEEIKATVEQLLRLPTILPRMWPKRPPSGISNAQGRTDQRAEKLSCILKNLQNPIFISIESPGSRTHQSVA
jgi:hypothetical protein